MAPVIEVGRGELGVLAIAQALFGHRTPMLAHLLRRRESVPDPLSPAALAGLEEILSTGWVLVLARRGGWRRRAAKRLWQRHPAPELSFSRFAVELCRWLAATPLGEAEPTALKNLPETLGDQLLCYLALDAAPTGSVQVALARQPAIRAAALAWLGFADVFGADGHHDVPGAGSLAEATGRAILDALGDELARRWVAMERAKEHIAAIDHMIGVGRAQRAVIDAALSGFDAAGRRELADFWIDAAARLAAAPWDPAAALDQGVSIAARSQARRQAAAFVRGLETVAGWVRQARAARFFDDDYDGAQRLLALWETLGDGGWRRLVAVATQLEAITAVESLP